MEDKPEEAKRTIKHSSVDKLYFNLSDVKQAV